MAAKKKNVAAQAAVVVSALAAIVEATLDPSRGFMFVPSADSSPLQAEGLVEVNPASTDAQGNIATRATQKGIDKVNAEKQGQGVGFGAGFGQPQGSAGEVQNAGGEVGSTNASEKQNFVIDDNIPVPVVTGRGRSGETMYPFDKLNVGQSFFVAKEAKNLASTISSANARYAEEIPGQTVTNRKGATVPAKKFTRQFIVRTVTENGVRGSRIWRKV